ncbi:hypothetical protein ACJMK2_038847 [Sinanodonta woodiana]|uniref:Uncharacterized protein n=1 Tax=Sinanodonta woodiana TaxID=1069815 RepID=A0ABD3WAB4_SINWO
MGVCTSKSTAVLSPNRSDTFINPTPVTFKRRGSGTNETDKEATAVTIQTESYEQRGGAARDDANSNGDRSINHATDGNKEGHEERNSSNERKPDTGRKAESTSLSSLTRDDANSTVRKDEGNIYITDTENERNILMTKAYPKLKTFCEKLGYEFQVVDMRWGVHDTATDSHTGTELCQKEIKLCQNLSTGPNFVSLVSHKYGYRMPPRTIESTIFEQIMSEIKKKENKDAIEMFQKWYRKDDNAVPSEYVFANITSHFSDYLSSEIDKKKNQSRSEYNKECEVMISALEETVAGIEYSKSVTEEETKCGLLEVKDACEHCVWFQRTIKEIEVQERSDILSKYIESGEDKSKRERSRKLLAEMKEKMTSKLLVDGKIKTYTVGWDKRVGINPEDKEHDSYLQKLADEFVTVLSSMIKDADEKRLPSDPVVEEVHRHIQFCKEKHTTFYGRDDCLRKIKEYVTGQSGEAMVVYGVSGCGKTSLMAEGAYLARQWTDPKAAVIIRFIGTSQRSTTINDLLQSLSHQIKLIYGANVTFAQNGITEAELEDILSCDEDVLNDVYKFWTPPIRRLPPLLLVRLKTDLEQYLVERDADGSRVFYWYHRQFKETAEEKYCSKQEVQVLLHTGLADFFSGLWANDRPKPFTYITKNDKGKDETQKGNEVRFVSAQPLKKKNLRKLNNLPYHRLKAGQLDLLKKECLCNFMFLLKKLRARNLWSVMHDFASAKKKFPEDEAIQMIHDALQISQGSLLYDPDQLPVQMILRLESTQTKAAKDFISQCEKSRVPYLLPDKNVLVTTEGQLVRSMAGDKENNIISVDVSKDGRHTVTCGDDEFVSLWNNVKGKLEHSNKTKGVQKAYFCRGDAFLLICTKDKVVVKDRSGNEDFFVILDAMSWCLCGSRRESLVLFKNNEAIMYNIANHKKMNSVECKKEVSFTSDSTQSFKGNSFLGSKRYAVAFSIQKTTLCLFDVSKEAFVLYHNVCPDSSIQKDDVDNMQWAITHNETCIAYTCSRSGYIRFVDIEKERTLMELHVISKEYNGEILDLQISRDKHYLTFILAGSNDKSTLVVYILEENELLERKSLNTSFTHASSSNATTVVTSSKDSSVQVWDMTRPKELQNTNTTTKDYTYLQCMPNSRYVLGTYSEGSEDKIWTLFVYDVHERRNVRRILFPTDVDVLLTGNNTIIVWPLIEDSKTAFLVDLKTMSVN